MTTRFRPCRLFATLLLSVVALVAAPAASAEPPDDGHSGYNGAPTVTSGGPVPTMNGVPCIAGNLGTCVGFAQNQPQPTVPQSTIGHSPTIRTGP